MMHESLVRFLHGVRRLTGASAAALYVPGPFRSSPNAILVSDGSLPSGFELFDLESAQAFQVAADEAGEGVESGPLASAAPRGILLALRPRQPLWALAGVTAPGEEEPPGTASRATDHDRARRERRSVAWLGLCFANDAEVAAARALVAAGSDGAAHETARLWPFFVELGGGLAGASSLVTALLKDPVSGLPDRNVFRIILGEAVASARARGRPLSVLFVNPDNFAAVNAALGRERADEVVSEISVRLLAAVRSSDFAARYGGVVFAVLLLDTSAKTAARVAGKLREALSETPYSGGAVALTVSAGVATFDPAEEDDLSPLELARRADRALLAAKGFGGGHVAAWQPAWDLDEEPGFDRLATVFTGDIQRDYRNMALLWETSAALAAAERVDELAGGVLRHIVEAFHLRWIALFETPQEGEPRFLHGIAAGEGRHGPRELAPERLGTDELALVVAACERVAPVESDGGHGSRREGEPHYRRASPLRAGKRVVGCLLVASAHELDATDLALVESIGRHLALAIHRRRMEEALLRREGEARQRLEEELEELRETLAASRLLYRSRAMDALLMRAARVAKTDATILITGESGTGKELLAKEIHRLSTRREGPFVIVDCGAIAPTLIESELFGHERGAYTGAQRREAGRLAQADGGTVLLDEITELPLASQVKLLRFVQEKQFVPVGGTQSRSVDARILAATNRDVAAEIAAGRFREDLYYRLNVVRLEIPPLRERRRDVLLLARRFLRNFGLLHDKPGLRFAREAEAELVVHEWPGNVRELQNRVQQAVILCQSDRIQPEDLGLGDVTASSMGAGAAAAASQAARAPGSGGAAGRSTAAPSQAVDAPEPWPRFVVAIRSLLSTAMEGAREPVPIGRWLADELVLAAEAAADGVASRGAQLAGLPETTFRRRLDAARAAARAGLAVRPAYWEPVRDILMRLVGSGGAPPKLARELRDLVEGEIERLTSGDEHAAAGWMGITASTWRRRRRAAKKS